MMLETNFYYYVRSLGSIGSQGNLTMEQTLYLQL